nr:P-loop NTPase fold protein [uncultured Porphyromonas sp.]
MSTNNASQNQEAGSKTATTQHKGSLKSICQRSLDGLLGWLAEVRVPFILGLLFLFLHQPIEQLAIERLVTPLLAHFNTGWLSSLIALGLALILLLRLIQLESRHYIVGNKIGLSAALILTAYLYYRCDGSDFEFYGLFGQTWPFAFADLIPIACGVPLFLWRRGICTKRRANQERQAAESVEGFLTDHPLTEEEEELSGWTSQAQTLTQKLLATDTTRAAFSLGIVASWGEGKSSFMGIMQRYLQQAQREVIVMRFNPWLYDKEAPLTKVFFEELRRTLAPYSSKLSKSIDNYTDLLLAVDSGWLKLAHEVLQQPQSSTAEQFDKLSQDIQELGRKVVIFIDDVDRLTREELMELFNLVRNSSNLPCIYFVLAYDKSYVLKTLQNEGEHMSRYPEKILQEEYPLPKLTPDKMWDMLEQYLRETQLGKEEGDKVSTLLEQLEDKLINLPYHLTTIRMVKRMVNAFSSRYELLRNVGVAPFDLFIFELIYYVYPSVYEFLVEMHKEALASLNASPEKRRPYSTDSLSSIFVSRINTEGMQYIRLHLEGEKPGVSDGLESARALMHRLDEKDKPRGMAPNGDKNKGQASSESSAGASGNTYSVVSPLKELALGLEDGYKKNIVVRRIVVLLDLLWGKDREPALGQINHETYWRRYFYTSLLKERLSNKEFASFLATIDRSDRIEDLKRWSQKKPSAFVQKVLDYLSRAQMQKGNGAYTMMQTILYAIFDWNTISSEGILFDHVEIDEFIRSVNVPVNLKQDLLLEVLKDEQVGKAAFDYIRAWLWRSGDKMMLLSEDDLISIQVHIFKREAKTNSSIPDLYVLWWLRCGQREGSKIKRAPEIDKLMRECIDHDIEGFLQYALAGPWDNTYQLLDIPWKNLTEFDKYLSKYSENPYVANFREFLSIALEREQELKQETPVIINIEPEQWARMHRPNFGSIRIYALDEDYPFYSAPPEENQD